MIEAARRAAAGDVPVVAGLARALRAELAAERGGALWSRREAARADLEAYFGALLDDAARTLVVGTIDDVIVAYGTLAVEDLADGSRLGVIAELFVEAGARAVGVGEAVATLLVDTAAAAGCCGVDAFALPGMRASKNFFEAHAFTARLLVMHHRIGERG